MSEGENVAYVGRQAIRRSGAWRDEAGGAASLGQTTHARGGHDQVFFLGFTLNCSGLDVEAKSTTVNGNTRAGAQCRRLARTHVLIIGGNEYCVREGACPHHY